MPSSISIGIIVIIGVVLFTYFKRKKDNPTNQFLSQRKNKDEVWKTIKQFLKDNGETGKEIVDSYVVKRNHIDYINPNSSDWEKENKNAEIKLRRWQKKQIEKNGNSGYSFFPMTVFRDLYVVVFVTKNTKTDSLDQPRCIECEIISTKINRKTYDRKIVINSLLDYDHEMEWIAPIHDADLIRIRAAEQQIKKQEEKKRSKEQKKLLRKRKNKNNANKSK